MKVSNWMGKADLSALTAAGKRELLLFAAKWCGYCTRFLGELHAAEFPSFIGIVHLIDTDNPDESLWDDYSISVVPTIIVVENGKEIFRRDGRSGAGLNRLDLDAAVNEFSKKA